MTEKSTLQGMHPSNGQSAHSTAVLDSTVEANRSLAPESAASSASAPPASGSATGSASTQESVLGDSLAEAKPVKKQISVAQRAVIAERTDRVLKSALPGSKEYADACAERASVGLVVPATKNTAMSMHAFEQFATISAAEDDDAHRKSVRTTTGYVLVGLLVLATGLGGYILFSKTDKAPTASTAGTATAAPTAPAKATTGAPSATGAAPAASAATAAPTASETSPPATTASSVAVATSAAVPNTPIGTGTLPRPNVPTSTPSTSQPTTTAAPSATWKHSW